MILKFSAENFRSIKERAVIDFTASADKSLSECLMPAGKKKALPVIALYGENSSGKTTVLKAFMTMREMICGKYAHLFPGEKLPYEPFALLTDSNIPSFFEVEYIHEDIRYLYSFSYDSTKILTEKLYYWPNGREALIFSRDNNEYIFRENMNEQISLAGRTADNRLYLTCSNEWNCSGTASAFLWFRNFICCTGLGDSECCGDIKSDDDIFLNELRYADPLIKSLTSEPCSIVYSTADGRELSISVESQPSGFCRYYRLLNLWINAFRNGSLIVLDELETGLSRRLTRHLIELMQSQKSNPNHAQLLCTTHDTYLMDQTLLRRDQMYITEKSPHSGDSVVHSLTYFSPRKDKRLDLGYMNGEFRINGDIQ